MNTKRKPSELPPDRSILDVFGDDRVKEMRHQEMMAGITLGELQDPEKLVRRLNGAAAAHRGSKEPLDTSTQNSLEDLTGYGDYDLVEARESDTEEGRQEILREKAARHRRVAHLQADGMQASATEAYRVLCSYRIIRELARLKGTIFSDQSLADVDLWEDLESVSFPGGPPCPGEPWLGGGIFDEPFHRDRKQSVRHIIETISYVEETYGEPFPFEVRRDDPDWVAPFLHVAEKISNSLHLERGSTQIPESGILGLRGLFVSEVAHLFWPSRNAILSFETLLLDEIARRTAESGSTLHTRTHITSKYGFMLHESVELVNLAMKKTSDFISNDEDIQRAQTVLSLEYLFSRAMETGDYKDATAALRLKAQVTNLMSSTGSDDEMDFVEGIKVLERARKDVSMAGSPPIPPEAILSIENTADNTAESTDDNNQENTTTDLLIPPEAIRVLRREET